MDIVREPNCGPEPRCWTPLDSILVLFWGHLGPRASFGESLWLQGGPNDLWYFWSDFGSNYGAKSEPKGFQKSIKNEWIFYSHFNGNLHKNRNWKVLPEHVKIEKISEKRHEKLIVFNTVFTGFWMCLKKLGPLILVAGWAYLRTINFWNDCSIDFIWFLDIF